MAGSSDHTITISDDDDEDDCGKVAVVKDGKTIFWSQSKSPEIQPRPDRLNHKSWVPPVQAGHQMDFSIKAGPPKKRYTEPSYVKQQMIGSAQDFGVSQTIYGGQSKSSGQIQAQPIKVTRTFEIGNRTTKNNSVWDTIGGIEVKEFTSKSNLVAKRMAPAQSTPMSSVNMYGNKSSFPAAPSSQAVFYGHHDSAYQPPVSQHGALYYPAEGVCYPHMVSAEYPSILVHPLPQSQPQPQMIYHQQPSIVVNAQQLSVVVNPEQAGQSTAIPSQHGLSSGPHHLPVSGKSDELRKSLEISPRSSAFTQVGRMLHPVSVSETQFSRYSDMHTSQLQQGVMQNRFQQQTKGKECSTRPVTIKRGTFQDTNMKTNDSGSAKTSRISGEIESAMRVKDYVEKVVEDSYRKGKSTSGQEDKIVSASTSRVSTPDSVIIESVEGPKLNYIQQQLEPCKKAGMNPSQGEISTAHLEDKDKEQSEESDSCNLTILETFSLRDSSYVIDTPNSESLAPFHQIEAQEDPPPKPDSASCSPEICEINAITGEAMEPEPLVVESFSLHSQNSCEDIRSTDICSLDVLCRKAFYQCCIGSCIFNTVSPSEFELHLVNVHSQAVVFVCVHCGHVASSSDSLIQHLHEHVSDELDRSMFDCSYRWCCFRTAKPDELLLHILQVHYEGDYHVCCKCNKTFKNVHDLVMHLKGNFLSVVKCPYCSAKDITKRNIIKHMKKSHPDKGRMVTVSRFVVCKQRAVTDWPKSPPSRCQSKSRDKELDTSSLAENNESSSSSNPKTRHDRSLSKEGVGSPDMPNITDDCYPKANDDPLLVPLSPRHSEEYIPIMSVRRACSGIEVEKIKSKVESCGAALQTPTNHPVASPDIPVASSSGTVQHLATIKTEHEETGYNLAIKQEPQENTIKQEPMDIDENISMAPLASGRTETVFPPKKRIFLSPDSVSKDRKRRLQRVNVCNKCDFYTSSNGAIYKHLHVVHKIDDMFQCSECQHVVCQEDVIEHHTKYHPNADENYVPTSLSHAYKVKYMEKSVFKSHSKNREKSKMKDMDDVMSTLPVENVATGLIEKFSEAKEGEVVKLSSMESNVLSEMLNDKKMTSAAVSGPTKSVPVPKKGKQTKKRKFRPRLTAPRKRKRKRESVAERRPTKRQRQDDEPQEVQVKKKSVLLKGSDARQGAEEDSEHSEEQSEHVPDDNIEQSEQIPDDNPEQSEDDLSMAEDLPKASEDSPCQSEYGSASAESQRESESSRYQLESFPEKADESLRASQDGLAQFENSSAAAAEGDLEGSDVVIRAGTSIESSSKAVSDQLCNKSPAKETRSHHPTASAKKSPCKMDSPGKSLILQLNKIKIELDHKDTCTKEPESKEPYKDALESMPRREPKLQKSVKKKSPKAKSVKTEPVEVESYTGPDLTFSQVNFDDPTYEFRCKYCTYRKGTLEKFLHHTYYHFHYRPYGCGHCTYKAFSHNRVLTHIKDEHPTKVNNPIVKRVEIAKLEARCQKTAMICFIPKHIEDVSLRIRQEKKRERALMKKNLKKENADVKVKKEPQIQIKKKGTKSKSLKTTTKRKPVKVKTVKKPQEGSYLCPYCRTNRPMMTWTKLVIEICYHIHYKPFRCNYCDELETASTLCLVKHIEKAHPKKEVVIKEQRVPPREARLKQLLQRSVDISKKHRQDLKMQELKIKAKKAKKKEKNTAMTNVKAHTKSVNSDTADKQTRVQKAKKDVSPTGDKSTNPNTKAETLPPMDMTIKKSRDLFKETRDDYGALLYECLKCDYTIRHLKSMYTHSYRHQPKIFNCAYCDYYSYPRSAVVWHQKQVHSHLKTSVINLAETANKT